MLVVRVPIGVETGPVDGTVAEVPVPPDQADSVSEAAAAVQLTLEEEEQGSAIEYSLPVVEEAGEVVATVVPEAEAAVDITAVAAVVVQVFGAVVIMVPRTAPAVHRDRAATGVEVKIPASTDISIPAGKGAREAEPRAKMARERGKEVTVVKAALKMPEVREVIEIVIPVGEM